MFGHSFAEWEKMIGEALRAVYSKLHSVVETCIGATLFSLPTWHHVITNGSEIAQFIASTCGAIIGLHGVWRIFRRYVLKGAENRSPAP